MARGTQGAGPAFEADGDIFFRYSLVWNSSDYATFWDFVDFSYFDGLGLRYGTYCKKGNKKICVFFSDSILLIA